MKIFKKMVCLALPTLVLSGMVLADYPACSTFYPSNTFDSTKFKSTTEYTGNTGCAASGYSSKTCTITGSNSNYAAYCKQNGPNSYWSNKKQTYA